MSDHSLTITREFAASPANVWRCLTEPELLKQWFAPHPVTCTRVLVEPVSGGAFHLVMQVPDMGEMDGGAGCVLCAEPERRIAWTTALLPGFVPAGPAPDGAFHFTAIMELRPSETGGTHYTATALHADETGRDAHAAMGFETGWGTTADQLGQLAANL